MSDSDTDCGCTCLFKSKPKKLLTTGIFDSASECNGETLKEIYYSITLNIRPDKTIKINGPGLKWKTYDHSVQRQYLNCIYNRFLASNNYLREHKLEFEICPNSKNIHLHASFADPQEKFNIDFGTKYFSFLESKYILDYYPVLFERTIVSDTFWNSYILKDQRRQQSLFGYSPKNPNLCLNPKTPSP